MNVHVESNFVLELALLQEQSKSCEELLRLCRRRDISLFIPAYSLAEPYETLVRRRKQRLQVKRNLDTELNQIARTATYADHLRRFDELTALLVGSADEDAKRLEKVLTDIVDVADIIPLEAQVLTESIRYQQIGNYKERLTIPRDRRIVPLPASGNRHGDETQGTWQELPRRAHPDPGNGHVPE